MTAPGGSDQAIEDDKRVAAEAAAQLVVDGMTVGLGTGSTVAYLLPALAARKLDIRCVSTSVTTETDGRRLGLDVLAFEGIEHLDIAIDGADQVAPDGWLVKGAGGAHVREKIVARAASRFVVIVSADKIVEALHPPVPVEVLSYGLAATLNALDYATVRSGAPASPDGGIIADWHGDVSDPTRAAAFLDAVPGVVGHGLFAPELVHDVIVSTGGKVEHRRL